MQVKVYVIDIPIPKRFLKAAAYVSAVVLVLALRSDVDATPTHFSSGTTLTAAAIQSLNIAVHGTTQYSVGPTAFSCTAPTTAGGSLGGYTGAKAMCATACASATAHMCSGDEIVRSLQLGYTLPSGYYSTAAAVQNDTDCNGWTASGSPFTGTAIVSGIPAEQGCGVTSGAVLCCD